MAGPFSFTGWSTSALAPTPAPRIIPTRLTGAKKGQPVNPNPVAAPGETTTVSSSVAPTSNFSFSGWSTSKIVPKVASAPIVSGSVSNLPANAIPIGTGSAGASNIPDVINQAQNTLETFSNPTLLGFFQSLLDQNKGGGGTTLVNAVAPGQGALNAKKLSLINEPENLAKQARDLQARQAALGPAPFGTYMGSEQQRIADSLIDVQTRYGPSVGAATAAGGLASPYRTISASNQQGLRRNASGWLTSPWM